MIHSFKKNPLQVRWLKRLRSLNVGLVLGVLGGLGALALGAIAYKFIN